MWRWLTSGWFASRHDDFDEILAERPEPWEPEPEGPAPLCLARERDEALAELHSCRAELARVKPTLEKAHQDNLRLQAKWEESAADCVRLRKDLLESERRRNTTARSNIAMDAQQAPLRAELDNLTEELAEVRRSLLRRSNERDAAAADRDALAEREKGHLEDNARLVQEKRDLEQRVVEVKRKHTASIEGTKPGGPSWVKSALEIIGQGEMWEERPDETHDNLYRLFRCLKRFMAERGQEPMEPGDEDRLQEQLTAQIEATHAREQHNRNLTATNRALTEERDKLSAALEESAKRTEFGRRGVTAVGTVLSDAIDLLRSIRDTCEDVTVRSEQGEVGAAMILRLLMREVPSFEKANHALKREYTIFDVLGAVQERLDELDEDEASQRTLTEVAIWLEHPLPPEVSAEGRRPSIDVPGEEKPKPVEGEPSFTMFIDQGVATPEGRGQSLEVHFNVVTPSGFRCRLGGGRIIAKSNGKFAFVPFGWQRIGAIEQLASQLGIELVPASRRGHGVMPPSTWGDDATELWSAIQAAQQAVYLRFVAMKRTEFRDAQNAAGKPVEPEKPPQPPQQARTPVPPVDVDKQAKLAEQAANEQAE